MKHFIITIENHIDSEFASHICIESSNRVGNIMQISNNYGNSGVYCGLSSDYDGASLGSTSTNFTKWRITPG